jgi:D-alanyl-D-alanine carboxypeptidase
MRFILPLKILGGRQYPYPFLQGSDLPIHQEKLISRKLLPPHCNKFHSFSQYDDHCRKPGLLYLLHMVNRHTWRLLRRIKRYLPIAAIIVVLSGLSALSIYTYSQQTTDKTSAAQAEHSREMSEIDRKIADAIEKRAEEERQRKAADAQEVAKEILSTPASNAGTIDSTRCNVTSKHANPASIDILVNKKHCLQPLNFAPSQLVTVNGATLQPEAAAAYAQLSAAAEAASQPIRTTSSYRSYQDQIETYGYWVRQSGAAGADTYSARPGYSEHQTGLAVDVAFGNCALSCFGSTPTYQWLQANAAAYGFIQRYYAGHEATTGYQAEEWHYRYVGVAIAQDMKTKGIKTLEEYWGIPGGTY